MTNGCDKQQGGGIGTRRIGKARSLGRFRRWCAPRRRLSFVCLALLTLLLVAAATPATARDFDQTHRLYDKTLKKYVDNGWVDYSRLKRDAEPLNRYLAEVDAVPETRFQSWNGSRQLALLFNLYNAATPRLIFDHYPVKSIKDIGSFFKAPWDQRVVRLFGKVIALDELEHDILRKRYNEPRLHLVLVCAAKGCPPLRSEAYTAERLDEQLDDQVKRFLTNPAAFRIDRGGKAVYLSSIFKWYGEDFEASYAPTVGFAGLSETQRAVLNFCARYLSDVDRKYLEAGGYVVKFLD